MQPPVNLLFTILSSFHQYATGEVSLTFSGTKAETITELEKLGFTIDQRKVKNMLTGKDVPYRAAYKTVNGVRICFME